MAPSSPPADAGIDGRSAVLAAALEVFSSVGLDAATTTAIARQANVTQPLVHYHFGTKAQLWDAAVGSLFGAMLTALEDLDVDLRDADPLTRLKALVRRYTRFVGAHPAALRLMHNIGALDDATVDTLYETHLRPIQDLLGEAVDQARAAGLVKDLPTDEVLIILVGAAGHVFGRAAVYGRQSGVDVLSPAYVDAHADAVVDVIFEGLVPRR